MSSPSSSTSPLTRAPGTISCIRFRQRMSVDLPHPEGPMIAVAACSAIASSTPWSACVAPNQASRWRTSSFVRVGATVIAARAVPSSYHPEATTGEDAYAEAREPDQRQQHQRSCPRLAMPIVERRDCIGVDLDRQRRDRTGEAVVPILVAERGEEERRCLAGDARDRQHGTGDDAPARGADDDAQRRPPRRHAEGERRLA